MAVVLTQEDGVKKVQTSPNRMAVAKIPCREKVEKAKAPTPKKNDSVLKEILKKKEAQR